VSAEGSTIERRLYGIPRRELDPLIEVVVPRAQAWWERHIIRREPVTETPSLGVLEVLRRQPKTTAVVPDDVMAEWIEARDNRLGWEARERNAKKKLLQALGTAEIGVSSEHTVTYFGAGKNGRVLRLKGT
jgi:hypothetical protein